MQQLVRACSKAVSAAGAASSEHSKFQDAVLKGLPAMAAQLLNSAAGHRLNAVEDVLLVFRE
jgi:hypothetical protein